MVQRPFFATPLQDCPVHKIAEKDSNKFVLLLSDPVLPFMSCVEIFEVGGQTPPNVHQEAYEYFYVIKGEGVATIGDDQIPLSSGAHLVVPPQVNHLIQNTGSKQLYLLTTMIPDENFSSLICSGPTASLNEEDIQVLCNLFDKYLP